MVPDENAARPGAGAARVRRTGLARVHEGEVILPAAGSEAEAERVIDDARTVVQYHFPVEIEVRGSAEPIDLEALADLTLRRLTEALRNG